MNNTRFVLISCIMPCTSSVSNCLILTILFYLLLAFFIPRSMLSKKYRISVTYLPLEWIRKA